MEQTSNHNLKPIHKNLFQNKRKVVIWVAAVAAGLILVSLAFYFWQQYSASQTLKKNQQLQRQLQEQEKTKTQLNRAQPVFN